MLRQEVLDAQFAGMRDALQNATPEDLQRIREMMSALNDMLDADARGEHTQDQFDQFMQQYGDFFPENPQNLDELIDSLARRAAAAQRLIDSLTPDQRDELGSLMQQALGQAGLDEQMARLQQGLRIGTSRPAVGRPGSGWTARSRSATPTPPARSPTWPTSTNSTTCSRRTIPAPASTTSTRN